MALPVYESKATPEEQAENRDRYYSQFRLIRDQEKDAVQSQHLKIRCGCLCLTRWADMYRCYFCGIWFCKDCASEHFGYMAERFVGVKDDRPD